MSQPMMTISRNIFFRLLAHAPEALQRQAKEDAQRAIPTLCFTEDDIRQKFLQEEGWEDLSEDEQHEAIEMLMEADRYEHAGAAANQAIAEAAAHYLADALLEKAERDAEARQSNLRFAI